jgi:hypothetical protein
MPTFPHSHISKPHARTPPSACTAFTARTAQLTAWEKGKVRRPCPSICNGHGVDVDCCLLLQAGSRDLISLSIQLDISVPRVAHTHEAPGFKGESEPPLPPSKKLGRDQLWIGNPPVWQRPLLKSANGLSSSSKAMDQGFQWAAKPGPNVSDMLKT